MQQSCGPCSLHVRRAREGEDALRRLAAAHGLAPAAALKLVALLLGDEAEIARRMLCNPDLAREALAAAFGARGKTAA